MSTQCEQRLIPDNNDFFYENHLGTPFPTDWAKEVSQNLFLNKKEKALFGGSVFIKGRQNSLGKKRVAITPMYIHELELSLHDEVYFGTVKETFFNPDFIELVNSVDPTLKINYNDLTEHAPANPFGYGNLVLLKNFFESFFTGWSIDELDNYQNPAFNYSNHYTEFKKSDAIELKILSFLMLGLFKKPVGSAGVMEELNSLVSIPKDTPLLRRFFQLDEMPISQLKARDILLPTTLSHKQERAFYGVDKYPISQVIGPPGTGKSFTISALAIDAICNNKSVLIITRNTQATRVITNIIEKEFGLKGSVVKAYNQNYKRSVVAKINKAITTDARRMRNPSSLYKRVKKIIRQIKNVEDSIIKIAEYEYKWGELYADHQDDFFSLFKGKWYEYQKRVYTPIWKLNQQLRSLRQEKSRLVIKYINAKIQYDRENVVKKRKKEFVRLNKALREKQLTRISDGINQVDYNLTLKALPLWATTTTEISKCLPLSEGLFDIIIFDEASQCDIATSIPAIYRAQQMIVVGDPCQLRHISFLSSKKQLDLKKKNSVDLRVPDYRKESLIDWTNWVLTNPDQSSHLDEHFRSMADLIRFSNHKFYDNQLKLIRSNPIADQQNSLKFIRLQGKRAANGANLIEANEIIKRVLAIIAQHQQSEEAIIPSIGISSPFADQVKCLKKIVTKEVPFDQLKRHDVLIGTPFHFQGEERDIMFISFCVDDEAHPGAINYLNRQDVFNVLITRARNEQVVLISVNPLKLPSHSLLKLYLETDHSKPQSIEGNTHFDQFFSEVSGFLTEFGCDIIIQSSVVSGVTVDLVFIYKERTFCIDLIGYPGALEEQLTLEELRILNRVNVPIFFLPYSSWHLDHEKVKSNLTKFINKVED